MFNTVNALMPGRAVCGVLFAFRCRLYLLIPTLRVIIRSHEEVPDGYDEAHDGGCVTVYGKSAPGGEVDEEVGGEGLASLVTLRRGSSRPEMLPAVLAPDMGWAGNSP
eukprot:gene5498-biopygen9635